MSRRLAPLWYERLLIALALLPVVPLLCLHVQFFVAWMEMDHSPLEPWMSFDICGPLTQGMGVVSDMACMTIPVAILTTIIVCFVIACDTEIPNDRRLRRHGFTVFPHYFAWTLLIAGLVWDPLGAFEWFID